MSDGQGMSAGQGRELLDLYGPNEEHWPRDVAAWLRTWTRETPDGRAALEEARALDMALDAMILDDLSENAMSDLRARILQDAADILPTPKARQGWFERLDAVVGGLIKVPERWHPSAVLGGCAVAGLALGVVVPNAAFSDNQLTQDEKILVSALEMSDWAAPGWEPGDGEVLQ